MIQRCIPPLAHAIARANIKPDQITDVVLTGGASKMPMLSYMLENFFQGKEIKKPENYHELSAMGAALEAGIVMGIVK